MLGVRWNIIAVAVEIHNRRGVDFLGDFRHVAHVDVRPKREVELSKKFANPDCLVASKRESDEL